MKRTFKKAISVSLMLLLLGANQVYGHFTEEEKQELLQHCSLPAAVEHFLDAIFVNPLLQKCLAKRISLGNQAEWEAFMSNPEAKARYSAQVIKPFEEIMQREYGITIIPSNNLILVSNDPKHPLYRYAIKIPKFIWPSKYQGISNVTRAESLHRLIEEKDLNNIMVPKHYVYQLPGKPEIINDSNYLVIMERVNPVYGSFAETKKRFEEIGEQETADDEETLTEIIQGMTYSKYWSVYNPSQQKIQLTFTNVAGTEKVAFLDMEQPGLLWYSYKQHGALVDEEFPHYDENDTKDHLKCGLEELDKLITNK